MAALDPVVIISAVRTPIGAFLGDLKELSAPALGAIAIRASMERAGIPFNSVDEVFFGCVLSAGLGQAPRARPRLPPGCRLPPAQSRSTKCAARV